MTVLKSLNICCNFNITQQDWSVSWQDDEMNYCYTVWYILKELDKYYLEQSTWWYSRDSGWRCGQTALVWWPKRVNPNATLTFSCSWLTAILWVAISFSILISVDLRDVHQDLGFHPPRDTGVPSTHDYRNNGWNTKANKQKMQHKPTKPPN